MTSLSYGFTSYHTSWTVSAPPPAAGGATPILVQSTINYLGSAQSTSKAFLSNNTAGNSLWLYATASDAPGPCVINTITDTRSNTWNVVHTSAPSGNSNITLTMAYVANAAAGANTVTVSWTAACDAAQSLWIAEYSGLDTVAPLANKIAASNVANTLGFSGSMIAPTGSKLFIAAHANDAASVITYAPQGHFAARSYLGDGVNYWPSEVQDFGTFSSNTITVGNISGSTVTISANVNGITIGAFAK